MLMPPEVIAIKQLGEMRACVRVDEAPEHPRTRVEPYTTIVAWHDKYRLADPYCPDTEGEFLYGLFYEAYPDIFDRMWDQQPDDSVMDEDWFTLPKEFRQLIVDKGYPGVLKPINMYDHGGIVLATYGFSDPWDSSALGWIYIETETMKLHGFSADTVDAMMKSDLNALQCWANGEIYELVIRFPDGSSHVSDGHVFKDGFPTDDQLDRALIDIDTLPSEALSVITMSTWEWASGWSR